jgi:hypothetical protein
VEVSNIEATAEDGDRAPPFHDGVALVLEGVAVHEDEGGERGGGGWAVEEGERETTLPCSHLHHRRMRGEEVVGEEEVDESAVLDRVPMSAHFRQRRARRRVGERRRRRPPTR